MCMYIYIYIYIEQYVCVSTDSKHNVIITQQIHPITEAISNHIKTETRQRTRAYNNTIRM